jgi:hypothetical protein
LPKSRLFKKLKAERVPVVVLKDEEKDENALSAAIKEFNFNNY